jgi:hypothetical protein
MVSDRPMDCPTKESIAEKPVYVTLNLFLCKSSGNRPFEKRIQYDKASKLILYYQPFDFILTAITFSRSRRGCTRPRVFGRIVLFVMAV